MHGIIFMASVLLGTGRYRIEPPRYCKHLLSRLALLVLIEVQKRRHAVMNGIYWMASNHRGAQWYSDELLEVDLGPWGSTRLHEVPWSHIESMEYSV